MKIFNSKHQKLILQCYPPGKGADKKPNPSELSYLLYYASTRTVKLEKVVTFLEEKTASDINHNRSGNLQVTLGIISALIEKCADNLNVFASSVCSILGSVLGTKELALCKSVVTTYGVFCQHLDGGLFSGDKGFVESFTNVSQDLISTGSKNSDAKGPNQLEWRMIALMAIKDISPCLGYNAKIGSKFISMAIPFLTKTIQTHSSQQNLLTRLRSNVNVESENHRLSRVVSSKTTGQSDKRIQEDFENDSLSPEDVTEVAFSSLKALFNTTLSGQISTATRAVVKHNHDAKIDQKWGATFLEMCTTWIPVQLRFVSLATLLARLTSISQEATSKNPGYGLQMQYAGHILGLVSSDVNMIGLSVSDIIQQILSLQSNLILDQSSYFKPEQVKKLSNVYSNCICNLCSHIYYYDQVPDSIQEILIKIDSAMEFSFVDRVQESQQNINGDSIHNLVMTLLGDISVIFSMLTKKSSSINRNHVKLEHWEISLPVISPETEYDQDTTKKTVFTPTQIIEIQIRYLKVFHEFLNNELTSSQSEENKDSKPSQSLDAITQSTDSLLLENYNKNPKDYLVPDVNQYLTNPDNFISHFLLYVHKFFNFHESPNTEVVLSLITVMKDMLKVLGVNFVTNFFPFLYNWLIPLNDISDVPPNAKFRDTIAHTVAYYCMKTLDDSYPEELNHYATTSKFFSKLLKDVEYRKLNKLWIHGLDSAPTDLEIIKNTASINAILNNEYEVDTNAKYSFTRRDFDDFVCGNNFTIVHINPTKSLDLDGVLSHHGRHTFGDPRNSSLSGGNNFANKFTESFQGSGSTPDSDVVSLSDSTKNNFTGRGLGTAGDINSIHSEILHNSQHFNGRNFSLTGSGFANPNGTFTSDYTSNSIYTSEGPRYFNSPRVADLKDLMLDHKRPKKPTILGDNVSTSTSNHLTSNSILSKQMAFTDLDSILNDLNTEDDARIIV
ncbi:uncharacterized protein RJT20DRAFT_143732 [Scheffersomyces xylosifermentans]|uniref:uncharacterized protein n=1 Tax=Scheffersomyces xylosifermentans TaxID=1304137 RepID=UPI00315C84FC